MTLFLFVLAAVCAVNAPRSISAVPGGGDGFFGCSPPPEPKPGGRHQSTWGRGYSPTILVSPAGRRLAIEGSVLTGVVLVPVALLAGPLLDLLDISAPTARIAVGLLLVVSGIVTFGWPPPGPEPALPGRKAALVPVAFPTLLTPGLTLLVVIASVDLGIVVTVAVTALAVATLPLTALLLGRKTGPVPYRVRWGLALLCCGLLVLAGFGLLFDGVFDV